MRSSKPTRRHKAARPVLVLVALALVGLLYAALAPVQQVAADDTTNASAVEEGRQLFAVSCASCHGLNAEGIDGTAPSLIGVGAAAVDFQVSSGRMPMTNPYVQAPRKDNPFTEEETAAMGAFVQSLGGGPEVPTSDQYEPEGLSEEAIARGGDMFRTNCSACHNFKGSGGALPNGLTAPSLEGVSAKQIWEALRTGPGEMPVFANGTIPDEDVKAMIGYLDEVQATPSAGLTLGGLGPVSEGFWGWIVGIGGLILFSIWITSKAARR